MPSLRRRIIGICGIEVPRRRFTAWTLLYFVAFACLPILAVASPSTTSSTSRGYADAAF